MADSQAAPAPARLRSRHLAIGLALTFPTLLTLVYFRLLAPCPTVVQQAVYALGKCLQFLFPLCWVLAVSRQRPAWPRPGLRGVGTGLAFGGVVLVATFLLYRYASASTGLVDGLARQVTQKVRDMGVDSLWKYTVLGVFYALVHSLLEEYYWRWFVFGQLRQVCSLVGAVALSSLGFMAHHVVLLGVFFGWSEPLTYLLSLAVAVGGGVWAWLYAWSGSLLGPWLSHLLVDAAIFLVGYDLARALF